MSKEVANKTKEYVAWEAALGEEEAAREAVTKAYEAFKVTWGVTDTVAEAEAYEAWEVAWEVAEEAAAKVEKAFKVAHEGVQSQGGDCHE